MKDKEKILFISSVNLTTNPRILKEIKLAVANGHQVTFLGFNLGNWSDKLDTGLQKTIPGVEFIYLNATREPFLKWASSTAIEKAARVLGTWGISSLKLVAFASSKRSVLLCSRLKKISQSGAGFDMVIAHTLGALYPAFSFAREKAIPFAFDVEDYHPWEWIKGSSPTEVKRREVLLKQILPYAQYVTTAAPLITKQVKNLVPAVNPVTVYNSFSKNEFVKPVELKTEKIKLVWFSQNINAGRGLEFILDAWENLKNTFELTLIGNSDEQFCYPYVSKHPDIILQAPVAQTELHRSLAAFDIGLAIDVDTEDKNRQLVITNKILAYYQAGLYIVATNTPAQQQFMNDHAEHGSIIEQNPQAAANSLLAIAALKEQIRNTAAKRFESAAVFNWENESALLRKAWDEA